MRAGCELRQKPAQVFRGENAGCVRDVLRERLQGRVRMKRHRDTGEIVKPFEKCGIDRDAEIGEWAKQGRVVGVGGGEHSGGGGRCFGERKGLLQNGDARAVTVKLQGERKADDSGPGDADVRMLHETSLVGMGKGIVWGSRFARAGAVRRQIAEASRRVQ